jgi:hypothetical protein
MPSRAADSGKPRVLTAPYARTVSTAHVLVVVGWPLETIGVVLIAAPELVPRAKRAVQAARARAAAAVRHLLRRHLSTTRASTVSGRLSASGTSSLSISDAATADEVLAFVRRQIAELQARASRVEDRVAGLPEEWKRDIAEATAALSADIDAAIERVRDAYIGWRLAGIACLLLGGTLLALANLVA